MEEYKIKKSPKKIVPRWLAFIISYGYLADFILLVVTLISGWFFNFIKYLTKESNVFPKEFIVSFFILVLTLIFFSFCGKYFEWSVNPILVIKSNAIVYKTDDVIAALGRATTTYTIRHIENYKVKKSSIIVEGIIDIQSPLEKKKTKNSCELVCLYDSDDMKKVIDELEKFKNKD